jgi:hypothetical protein
MPEKRANFFFRTWKKGSGEYMRERERERESKNRAKCVKNRHPWRFLPSADSLFTAASMPPSRGHIPEIVLNKTAVSAFIMRI